MSGGFLLAWLRLALAVVVVIGGEPPAPPEVLACGGGRPGLAEVLASGGERLALAEVLASGGIFRLRAVLPDIFVFHSVVV